MAESDTVETAEPTASGGFLGDVSRHAHSVDAIALVAAPSVLVAVQLLPSATKGRLALSSAQPTMLSFLTAHYVHGSIEHLLGNLAVYALVVPVAYLLTVLADRRSEFFVAFVTFLFVLPPVLSGLNLALLDRGELIGFSGVVMAFVGFLPIAIVWYTQAVAGVGLELDHAPGLFFLGLAAIALWSVPVGLPQVVVAGAAGVIGLVYAVGARSALDGAMVEWQGRAGYVELGGAGLIVFGFGVAVGFPTVPVVDGMVLNHYGHFLGYAIGFVAPYVTFRVDTGIR